MEFMIWTDNLKQTALRYCNVPKAAVSRYEPLLEELRNPLRENTNFRFTFRVFDLERDGDSISVDQGRIVLSGRMAQSLLAHCEKVLILGATLSGDFDRQLSRFEIQNSAKALVFDALGSALIDEELDACTKELQQKLPGWYFSDRFSCGYGDLPLSLQSDLAGLLNLTQTIGVHVLPSCMMVPTKSVTAFIGLSRTPLPAKIRGCAYCPLRPDCKYLKGGLRCYEN